MEEKCPQKTRTRTCTRPSSHPRCPPHRQGHRKRASFSALGSSSLQSKSALVHVDVQAFHVAPTPFTWPPVDQRRFSSCEPPRPHAAPVLQGHQSTTCPAPSSHRSPSARRPASTPAFPHGPGPLQTSTSHSAFTDHLRPPSSRKSTRPALHSPCARVTHGLVLPQLHLLRSLTGLHRATLSSARRLRVGTHGHVCV